MQGLGLGLGLGLSVTHFIFFCKREKSFIKNEGQGKTEIKLQEGEGFTF